MKGRAVQSFVWIMKFDADTSPQGKRVRGCLIFHKWRLSVSFCGFNTSVKHSERSTIDLDAISLNPSPSLSSTIGHESQSTEKSVEKNSGNYLQSISPAPRRTISS